MSGNDKEVINPFGNESLTTYKLMIMWLLEQTDFPLTDSQLSEFFVSHDYVDYFQFRRVISELTDTGYLSKETIRNMTNYHVTASGKEALAFFDYMIPGSWMRDMMSWLKENSFQLRREVEITAEYYPVKKTWKTEYMVNARIREKGELLMELTLNVVSKEQAIEICDRWQNKSDQVYGTLMNLLLLDGDDSTDDPENKTSDNKTGDK